MMQDELDDPNDPLGERFQNEVFERGRQLEGLRARVPTDAEAARQFGVLVAKQLEAYQALVHAAERFPAADADGPVATFRQAMAREIQGLRDDAASLRSTTG